MQLPHPARKWMTFLALLLTTAFQAYATRESAVANSTPESGTSKIVVKNQTFYSLNVTVGDQVAYNFPNLAEKVFENATLFKPPYLIKITFVSHFPETAWVTFTNPNSESPYTTPQYSVSILLKNSPINVATKTVDFFAVYEWLAGYWVVTLKSKGAAAISL